MAEAMLPGMTPTRQDLHKHAETGWLEMRTSSIIARTLSDLGYKVLAADAVKIFCRTVADIMKSDMLPQKMACENPCHFYFSIIYY